MKVIVAVYSHRHGGDVRVFKTDEGARKWRRQIAEEEYPREMNEPPPTDREEAADRYFERLAERGDDGESFSTEQCEVED